MSRGVKYAQIERHLDNGRRCKILQATGHGAYPAARQSPWNTDHRGGGFNRRVRITCAALPQLVWDSWWAPQGKSPTLRLKTAKTVETQKMVSYTIWGTFLPYYIPRLHSLPLSNWSWNVRAVETYGAAGQVHRAWITQRSAWRSRLVIRAYSSNSPITLGAAPRSFSVQEMISKLRVNFFPMLPQMWSPYKTAQKLETQKICKVKK